MLAALAASACSLDWSTESADGGREDAGDRSITEGGTLGGQDAGAKHDGGDVGRNNDSAPDESDSGPDAPGPCGSGFTGSPGACVNIDECFEGKANCHSTAKCKDREGSYDCTCPEGMSGGGPLGIACMPQIAGTSVHACAVNAEGQVLCWGDNSSGQLGDGTMEERSTPTVVPDLPPAAAVVIGNTTTACALLRDRSVRCWGPAAGSNWGDGSLRPIAFGGLKNITQISLNGGSLEDTGCAVDVDGALFCWGANELGQTGTGEATGLPLRRPVRVEGIGPVAWVSVGHLQSVTCATLRTGKAYCWGEGLLTGPAVTTSAVPVAVPDIDDALSVQAFFQRVCALRFGGSVTCWGAPTLIANVHEGAGPENVYGLFGGASVLAGGLYHTCALSPKGELRCWDAGIKPKLLEETSTFISVATSGAFTYGVKADGSVVMWDMNGLKEVPSMAVDLW